MSAAHGLSSANSINVGRLLPQMVYYAAASLEVWHREGRKANFVVPSGNLGNVTAGVWAREVGLPIGDIVLATNANPTVTEFLDGGAWRPRASVPTLASAMDVGNPSNMERLRTLFPDRLATRVSARLVTDEQIRATIRQDAEALGYVWDPHGATAAHVYHHALTDRADEPWVLVGDGAPGQVQRDRGAAGRTGHPGAAGSGAPVAPAAAGGAPGADARRVTRAALTSTFSSSDAQLLLAEEWEQPSNLLRRRATPVF